MIGRPPFDAGAENSTVAAPSEVVTFVIVGAPGAPVGVIGFAVGADAALVPRSFVAVIVNVYGTPLDRPAITIGLPDPVPVRPSGLEVTVYEVIGEPPSDAGAEKVTDAVPSLADTAVMAGEPGAPVGVTDDDGADDGLVPSAFVAVTENV